MFLYTLAKYKSKYGDYLRCIANLMSLFMNSRSLVWPCFPTENVVITIFFSKQHSTPSHVLPGVVLKTSFDMVLGCIIIWWNRMKWCFYPVCVCRTLGVPTVRMSILYIHCYIVFILKCFFFKWYLMILIRQTYLLKIYKCITSYEFFVYLFVSAPHVFDRERIWEF